VNKKRVSVALGIALVVGGAFLGKYVEMVGGLVLVGFGAFVLGWAQKELFPGATPIVPPTRPRPL